MKRNKPVVSTAKVRGMIKKNGIGYVDATRKYYPTIANGITVWQLCDNVYFKVYGFCNSEKIANNLKKFAAVLDAEGFTYEICPTGSHKIVKKVGA